jgi:hypothetical protein
LRPRGTSARNPRRGAEHARHHANPTAITRLISTGTSEQALLAAIAQLFPNLSPAELSQALQVATAGRSGRLCGLIEEIAVSRILNNPRVTRMEYTPGHAGGQALRDTPLGVTYVKVDGLQGKHDCVARASKASKCGLRLNRRPVSMMTLANPSDTIASFSLGGIGVSRIFLSQ